MTRDRARILDASANRAAEALRVMEDAARFLLDDRDLTAQLKALRHDLRALTPSSHHRDAAGDVGTTVSTEAETFRSGARHVVVAAAKRLQESLRSLEEWSKASSLSAGAGPDVRGSARAFEQLRYRAYALEQRLPDRPPPARGPAPPPPCRGRTAPAAPCPGAGPPAVGRPAMGRRAHAAAAGRGGVPPRQRRGGAGAGRHR